MTLRLLALLSSALLLCGCAGVPRGAPDAAAQACAATARSGTVDPRIRLAIEEARLQHQLFGRQTIGRHGNMVRVGYHEAEWSRPAGASAGAWQRVAAFWRAVPQADALGVSTSAGRVPLSQVLPVLATFGREPGAAELALRESLLRAASVDTPWSAAFISHVMQVAGFSSAEFAFSDSHVDYVRAALATSAAEAQGGAATHAFRACDVATTPPRPGDLLCATRGSTARIATFGALPAALAARPVELGFPMHCDLVVRADAGGGTLEVIGGNVADSVTLSRMTLNARRLLGEAYRTGAGPRRDCARAGAPCPRHLSRRPWLVLLQFRG